MVVRACDVMNNVQLYSVFVASHCELAGFGDDTPGGLQGDVVYLWWPIAPSYNESKCGGRGELRTDKKENKIFLIYMEIQMGSGEKSYMRKGFLIYEEMHKYLHSYMRRSLVICDFAPNPSEFPNIRAGHSLIFSRFAIRSPLNFSLWIADAQAFIF
jgi:hypothetical protein